MTTLRTGGVVCLPLHFYGDGINVAVVVESDEPLTSWEHGDLCHGAGPASKRGKPIEFGRCVSRIPVVELRDYPDTTIEINLEQISPHAGRALLRVKGVRGSDAELEQAVISFGGSALALTLLAGFLHKVKGHNIAEAANIRDRPLGEDDGKHAKRILAAYEQRHGDDEHCQLLRVLGLFDRPAEDEWISAVATAGPEIPGLTNALPRLGNDDWHRLLQNLRDDCVIAPENRHRPSLVEAHPVVREYFAQAFRKRNANGWREAHSRLYDYFEDLPAKHLPSAIPDLIPLYAAVRHGCEAGRYNEAMWDVYIPRICRGKEFYSKYQLGAFGLDLAAISCFFESLWGRQVEATKDMGFIYNEAGTCLASLLRMEEAVQVIQQSWFASLERQRLDNAVIAANTLSFHYLTMGDWKWRSGFTAFDTMIENAGIKTQVHAAHRNEWKNRTRAGKKRFNEYVRKGDGWGIKAGKLFREK
jgi:hypothetical protein